MATAAISGVEFWHETEFGKALAKVLPPEITRVIIDIPVNGAVKIYYASVNTGPMVDLKWDEIIEQLEIVKPKENSHEEAQKAQNLTAEDTEGTEKKDKEIVKLRDRIKEIQEYIRKNGGHQPSCGRSYSYQYACVCGFEQAIKSELQYVCARCGFQTECEHIINKHSAECKVPLNQYGG